MERVYCVWPYVVGYESTIEVAARANGLQYDGLSEGVEFSSSRHWELMTIENVHMCSDN